MKLLFRDHFLINATNKVGAGHSMQRRKLFLIENFLLSYPLSPLPLLLTLEHHKMPITLITFPSSSG